MYSFILGSWLTKETLEFVSCLFNFVCFPVRFTLIPLSVHWGTINFLISLTGDIFCDLGGKNTKKERKLGSRDFSYLILVYGVICKPGADEKKKKSSRATALSVR